MALDDTGLGGQDTGSMTEEERERKATHEREGSEQEESGFGREL